MTVEYIYRMDKRLDVSTCKIMTSSSGHSLSISQAVVTKIGRTDVIVPVFKGTVA
jgi:hypothetical protein